MNLKRLFLFFSLFLLVSLSASAQNKLITGKITDSAGTPLSAISVTVKGAKIGTQTASDGTFKLNVPSNTSAVQISSIGYATQEMSVSNGNIIAVMHSTSGSLNDVVVVAYGTRRKGDLTGSVVSVTAKDFQKGNITSPDQLLVGKVAGLQITSGGGSPASGSKIRIRGGASLNASNDPLIVIDGVSVDNNSLPGSSNLLNTIDPNDIESISVLKDASATALYGSRASNGVIIVTTKKGVPGKVKFNFNTQLSLSKIAKQVDVLNGDQIRTIVNDDAALTGDSTWQKLLGSSNTDWQNLIYQTAVGTDNNLSASGAVLKMPFRISGGYSNQQGILDLDNFSRISTALNLSPKFFDNYLSVNLNVKYSHTKNNFTNQGAIGNAVSFDPSQSPYAGGFSGPYPDFKAPYGGYFEWLQSTGKPIGTNGSSSNPNPLDLLAFTDNISSVNRVIGNVQIDYKLHFFPDLHVLVNLGLDYSNGTGHNNIDSLSSSTAYKTGIFNQYRQSKMNALADVSLFYAKDIKNINSKIDVLAGHSYQNFYTNVYGYPNYNQLGVVDSLTIPTNATDKPQYRLESYFGRINFTIADKYLFTGSIRRDASSKFSPGNRIGYFPAGAFAWKLKEEFFKKSNLLSELKLRLGLGVTGQQDGIGYYSYLPVYYKSGNTAAEYQFGTQYYPFLRPSAYDPNIKWETTTTANIGLDYGFFNNRISGSIDFYRKKTKDLLSVVPVAPGANFDVQILTNVGNMENKGLEFTVNTTPVRNNNFSWDLNFNFSYNKSKITNLLKYQDPNFSGIAVSGISGGTGNNVGKFAVGYAPYTFFVYKQVYDPKTGAPIEGLYEDINRDGQITAADEYYYKKPAPDFLGGISTQFRYRQWTLGIAGHAEFGNYLYNNYASNNGVLRAIENPLHFIQNASADYLTTHFTNNQYLSDYYIQNASFFRLDNINIGYNAGKVWHNRATLAITGNVQNVFIITKYKGLDPENPNDSGVDNNIYPHPRVYSLGINLNF